MSIGDLIEYDQPMGISRTLFPFTAIDIGNGQMAIYTSEGNGTHSSSATKYVPVPEGARIIAVASELKAQRVAENLWFDPVAVLDDMRREQQEQKNAPSMQGRKPAGSPGSSGGQFTGRSNTPPQRGSSCLSGTQQTAAAHMVCMSSFDEAQHPRDRAGTFTAKVNRPPTEVLAVGDSPKQRKRRGAALVRGTFGDFELSKFRRMQGREGAGFTATLCFRGRPSGTVTRSGDGGATHAHITDQSVRGAFRDLVNNEWSFDTEHGVAHAEEHVLDALALDHEMARKLRRERQMQTLPIMFADDVAAAEAADGLSQYRVITHGVGHEPGIARDLKRRGMLEGAMYFDGAAWVPFDTA